MATIRAHEFGSGGPLAQDGRVDPSKPLAQQHQMAVDRGEEQ
jgi:hypothetical protein